MIRAIFTLLCVSAVMFLELSCSVTVAGGSSSTDNGKILGVILQENNQPASNTQVKLLPLDFDLFNFGPFPDSLICTTDVSGRYTFIMDDTGTFNIQACHLSNGTRLHIPRINHDDDSTFVPFAKLAGPGVIKVFLHDTVNTAVGYLYIAGTTSGRRLSKSIAKGRELILYLDSIPAGTFSELSYNFDDGPDIPIPCSDTFTVYSNDTTTIDAFTFWVNYTQDNSGLPINNIRDVFKDAEGLLWASTQGSGIARLTGSQWKVFTRENSDIPSNITYKIVQENNGLLWFTSNLGVTTLSGTIWYTYNKENSDMPGSYTNVIDFDSKGNKWLGMHNDGLVKYDGSQWAVYDTSNSNAPDDNIIHLDIDNDDHIWCASNKGGAEFNGNTWTIYTTANSGIYADTSRCVKVDKLGNTWFSHRNGVSRFNGSTWTTYDAADSPILRGMIYSICEDVHGNLFFGTTKGLTMFDGTKWVDFTGKRYPLLTDILISAIYIDTDNNKWLGTWTHGVIGFGPSVK